MNGAGLNSICSSDGLNIDVITAVSENINAINFSVQPNPFNENTTLFFFQKTEQAITISLIDILGKEILIANNIFTAGEHSIDINSDKFNLASGVYTFRISSDKYTASIRLIKYK